MPNQADRYEALRLRLIDAAERTISESGLAALKARDLARAAGCSVGTIYNVFEHLDELILCVGSRTLAMLDGALAGAKPLSVGRSGRRQPRATAPLRISNSPPGTLSVGGRCSSTG